MGTPHLPGPVSTRSKPRPSGVSFPPIAPGQLPPVPLAAVRAAGHLLASFTQVVYGEFCKIG